MRVVLQWTSEKGEGCTSWKSRLKMKVQFRFWRLVIMWMWFERALHDASAGRSPTAPAFVDANLMFEFLLGGVELNKDNNIVLLDEEMASMRQGRAFLSQINDNIPRSLSSMEQMVDMMKSWRKLTQGQFESLVLSTVLAAQQVRNQHRPEDQEAWGGVLLQLANVTVHDLRGSYIFSYA
ncbi:protein FAM180A [Syngnathoides biaculeatus]|uniref:protein FAM180A n=1 Tax=Syngnathoides biaculeatus TaxID=300417 RepID=UPI002ADD931B|nr:protein FAM180A [Syngnathoides biaculeatus]